MEAKNEMQDINRFGIIFEKMEEAKKAQDLNFNYELEVVSETNNTISFFKEFQESINESSCSYFTRS